MHLEGYSALFMCILMIRAYTINNHSMFSRKTMEVLGENRGGYDWIMYMTFFRGQLDQPAGRSPANKVFDILCTTYCRALPPNGGDSSLRASDKRDYIYGLFGLFEEDDVRNQGLAIDYRQSWQDLYCDVARKMIKAGNLDILSLCQAEKDPILPSWTPVWHETISSPNVWFKSIRHDAVVGNALFNAAFTSKVDVSFERSVCQKLPLWSMHIKGIFVDEIMSVRSVYARARMTSIYDREPLFGRLFRDIECLCEESRASRV